MKMDGFPFGVCKMTDEIEYIDFDPPHYERIVQGKMDEIIQLINDFVENDGVNLQLKFASRGKGFFFDALEKQPNGKYSIFVSSYDENEKQEPLGPIIQFEFIKATENNRVKVRGDCYYDDTAIIEYFNTLW